MEQAFSDPELEAVLAVGTKAQTHVASTVIGNYKECQIHGEVNLSEHVACFVINEQWKNGQYRDAVERMGKKHGVPVFWMDEVSIKY